MPEMNKSAKDALALARTLGGEPFITFLMNASSSQAMADHVLRGIERVAVNASKDAKPTVISMSRLCDKAFVIGLYEAWSRLKPEASFE
jgi:hypothetical protein